MKFRNNLVVVRAGDKSLHPQWLGNDRNWDVALSYYGDFPERYRDQYDFIHHFRGSKWEGLYDFFKDNEKLIANYEYIWLPDDDILTTCGNVNNFFDICSELNLIISQPALTSYSYYSWEITLQRSQSYARYTNFIEIMAPCFKAKEMALFSRHFNENTSGWGYEWLWNQLAINNNINRLAIVDATPVFHTRPVGAAGHGGSKFSPELEMRKLFDKYELKISEPIVIKSLPLE